ncbi:MAG TPA: hypothetical protein VGQ44_17980 [Gemmatimonadaceae bacterium]|nr:hypothetical protein [Gemmatimonadaceae bacterium]
MRTIYQCVMKAYDAGANGIVVSPRYEELDLPMKVQRIIAAPTRYRPP